MKLLTPDEVAEQLRLPTGAVLRGTLRRQLPWLKLAGKLRLTQEALDQFITGAVDRSLLNTSALPQSQRAPAPFSAQASPARSGRQRRHFVYRPLPELGH
jgi:hypothetical protein